MWKHLLLKLWMKRAMKFLGKYILLALIFLSGCATQRSLIEYERLGRYRFDYAVEADRSCGIVQAFDDGEQIYVQVLKPEKFKEKQIMAINGVNGQSIGTTLIGSFILLNGRSEQVTISFKSLKKVEACKTAHIFLIKASSHLRQVSRLPT